MTRSPLFATLFSVGLTACGGGAASPDHGAHGHPPFKSPEEWSQRFDDPARAEWQKPDAVINHLKLSSDSTVADIGAGTGYFTVRLSPMVPVGRVYAVDLEPSMVEYTQKRAASLGQKNVTGIVGAADDPRLPEAVEVILLVDTYHHLSDRTAYFKRLRSKLKPGGRLAIVDYKASTLIPGPPQAMRLTPDAVIDELDDAGYRLTVRSEGALPRQYILIFEAAGPG